MDVRPVLKVTSHVGRDLLQAAASFKTDYAATWEYVVNGLQYTDEGVLPRVQVSVRPRSRSIEIIDNGRGMTATDLERFFKMHAENVDRLHGRPGRGKFGTGKSAAFGIGRALCLDTRRDGLRNVVRLSRDAIDASSGEDVPIDWLVRDEPTEQPNGTTVTIDEVAVQIKVQGIIEFIERHLQAFRARLPEVAVNEHVCQYKEPQIVETFRFYPSADQQKVLGDVELTLNVSPSPLPSVDVGVSITAGPGNLVAMETAGVDRKELGNFLFGQIDVPALETFQSTLEPYDATRSLQLNPQHPVCGALIPFIGSKLDEVRLAQVKKLAEARRSEQARRLAAEADKIAEILNQDFRRQIYQLEGIRAVTSGATSAGARFGKQSVGNDDAGTWVEGTEEAGNVEQNYGKPPHPKHDADAGSEPPSIVRSGQPEATGKESLDRAGGTGKRSRPGGGFRVEYRQLGENEDRSKYDRTTLTILINLDHPAVRNAARSGGIEDAGFKRLSYEIAFTEYAVALGYAMAERDPDIPADELLFEIHDALARVTRNAAMLYA